jgi:hypothetical protein
VLRVCKRWKAVPISSPLPVIERIGLEDEIDLGLTHAVARGPLSSALVAQLDKPRHADWPVARYWFVAAHEPRGSQLQRSSPNSTTGVTVVEPMGRTLAFEQALLLRGLFQRSVGRPAPRAHAVIEEPDRQKECLRLFAVAVERDLARTGGTALILNRRAEAGR